MVTKVAAAMMAVALIAACGSEPADGPRLALGEKGSLDLPGSEATRDLSFPRQGDGSLLAYRGDSGLLSANFRLVLVREGKTEQLSPKGVNVEAFAWMPDGRSLAAVERPAVSPGPATLVFYDLDGKVGRRLDLPGSVYEMAGLTVHPSGATAVVSSRPLRESKLDLAQVDLVTGAWTPLTDTPQHHEGSPVFIDADRLAYVYDKGAELGDPFDSEVVVRDMRTGEARVLTRPGIRFGTLAVMPDRSALVVDASHVGAEDRGLWTLPMTGGDIGPLHDSGGPFALEPDGTHAVVLADQSRRLERVALTPSGT